jgi:hypothetical protein
LERRFDDYVHESSDNDTASLPATHATPASGNVTERHHFQPPHNDVQSALREESKRLPARDTWGKAFRDESSRDARRETESASRAPSGDARRPLHDVLPATPAAAYGERRQQSITAMSPGPSRPAGSSLPYPDDDPPAPTGLRGAGFGTTPRAEYTCASLHVKPDSLWVCWQMSHTKGPYGGNHDHLIKFVHELPGDFTTDLMLLFNYLRTEFQAAGFHNALLPDIGDIVPNVDLTRSPVDPRYMSNRDNADWSHRPFWANLHHDLGYSLHRVLSSVSRASKSAPIFARVVSEHAYGGNGFAVLNDLLRLHFPHVEGTQAPSFDTAATKKVHQDSDELLPDYERRFTLWLQSLQLFREFSRYPDSEVTMWFIDGLLARHQLFLSKEYVDLKQFHSTYRLIEHEPTLLNHLQRYFLSECLRLSIVDEPRCAPRSTPMGSQVALIDGSQYPQSTFLSDSDVAAIHQHRQNGHAPNSHGRPFSRGPPFT